jgi:hypothetical protein
LSRTAKAIVSSSISSLTASTLGAQDYIYYDPSDYGYIPYEGEG